MGKRWICLIMAALLLFGGALAENVGNQLGFEMLRALNDDAKNQVISPISLTFALAMAAEGAQGETQAQMLDALEIDTIEEMIALIEPLRNAGVKIANAAFAKEDLQPLDEYVTTLREMHDAEWFEGLDADSINAWVREKTDGMIEKMIDVMPDAELALVNAVAMDAQWRSAFRSEDTKNEVFHAQSGDIEVPMMHQTMWARYGTQEDIQFVRLAYCDSSLAMYAVLPGEGGVSETLDRLCEQGMDFFAWNEDNAHVELALPKTDIMAENRLNETLIALGMELPFSSIEADFSGISATKNLYIDSILQKARLMIDEDGTRAAVATVIMIAEGAAPITQNVELTFDRPYVIVIAEEETQSVVFAAVIANPSES